MTTKTDTYVLGMKAINSFYSMLIEAMRAGMPEAKLSQSGAYVWRGYQIVGYKELAHGQYYCQIYPGNPEVLIFQEGYLDAKRKASNFEKQKGIMQGRYYYPFSEKLDLIHTRFFDYSEKEQQEFLKNFVAHACEQAQIWQNSEARDKATRKEFKFGKVPVYMPVKVQGDNNRVGIEFLKAWKDQTSVLEQLKSILERFSNVQWVRPNASIHNFDFRGMRLKFRGASVTSRWSVYFQEPNRLKFQIPGGKRNSYNLVDHGYFDLPSEEQIQQLTQFAQESLGRTI